MTDCWAQDAAARPSFQEITQRLRQLSSKYPTNHFGSSVASTQVEAPEGNVVFIQTSIPSGNLFWEKHPSDMLEAISKLI